MKGRMYGRRFFAIAFVFLVAVAAVMAADPPTWGFIDVNVTCKTLQGKSFRVKLVSKIFSYCGPDISEDQILKGNNFEIEEGARSSCGSGTHEITYSFVAHDANKDNLAKYYDKQMNDPEYQKHEKFACSCAYYMSTKCRSSNY
jgi:hypothetical protein